MGGEIWVVGDTRSDDAVKGGDAGDKADAADIDNFVENTNNGVVATIWANYYEGITRCNYAIVNVGAMSTSIIDADLKDRIIAEAKFLRAYYYFLLINIYGDVPLLLEPKIASELQIAPSTVSEIYAQIEQDCDDAQKVLLPRIPSGGGWQGNKRCSAGPAGKKLPVPGKMERSA